MSSAHVPEAAAEARVTDLEGGEHALGELWQDRTAVVGFLRHFGCIFCREHAVLLHRALPQIRAASAELHLVGNGNRRFGQAFRDEFGIVSPIWIDTARETYKALGMKRGVMATLLASFKNRARAAKSGFRQGLVKGDPWQLGGVLVVRPGGEMAYRYLSDAGGDHPPVEDVLRALRG